MSKTCTVYVGLEHGIIIGASIPTRTDGLAMDDAARMHLPHGFNEDVPRERVERWLKQNSQLAVVKKGLVRVIPDDVLAVDSNRKK